MSKDLVKQPIVWVDNDRQLEALCERWRDCELLAVDTEFERSHTYYPKAGLIQINDGHSNYLIDPAAIHDFFPLTDVFDDPGILIVMHSCSEDLEVFQHTLGAIPTSVIDTQIACALVGVGFSAGYAKAVTACLGVDLPKAETRSNWLARPLSQAQLFYAALDVEYLYQLFILLREKLDTLDRWSWLLQDCEKVCEHYRQNQIPELSYLRIKSAWKLNARQLACLQSLAHWREVTAQLRNIPRNRVVKEPALLDVAKMQPTHLSQLRKIDGFIERMIKADGQTLIDLVSKVDALANNELPETLPPPLNAEQNQQAKVLRTVVKNLAEVYQLPPEVLMKKRDYEFIVRTIAHSGQAALPANLHGWRQQLIGDALLTAIDEWGT